MSMIISSVDLGILYEEVSKNCRETGKPVFVTKDGREDAVILSMEAYDELLGVSAIRDKVLRGVSEAEEGMTISAKDVCDKARAILG